MTPRTIDLIRTASAPATVMRLAARGALAVPGAETLEILVYLAKHNQTFGPQAAMTLAGWDENVSKVVAADPATSAEVLEYLTHPQNVRPALLPALVENPSVNETALEQIARAVSGDSLDVLLSSQRVAQSPLLQRAIHANLNLKRAQAAKLRELQGLGVAMPEAAAASNEPPSQNVSSEHTSASPEGDVEVATFLKEHAAEVAREGDKPFQPLGGVHEESPEAPTPSPAVPAAAASRALVAPPQQKGSTLQKIAGLGITGRIQLAMKGTKEERSLLVRDGTKIVALAVLESPKISDGEVEKIASQKNVLEAVLRQIPMKRRFAKNYNIVRNLVANPRTPLDVALGLMKNLMVADLKALSGNKEVAETIRKLALRQFKQKSETGKKD